MKSVDVNPATRFADSLEIDDPEIVFIIFEIDAQNALFSVLDGLEILHVSVFLEDSSNLILCPRSRDIDLFVFRMTAISDSGLHIRNGI